MGTEGFSLHSLTQAQVITILLIILLIIIFLIILLKPRGTKSSASINQMPPSSEKNKSYSSQKSSKNKKSWIKGIGGLILFMVSGVIVGFGIITFKLYAEKNDTDIPGAIKEMMSEVFNQEDYLDGHVFEAPGTLSGGMYTYGPAFYFEDGRAYAGLEGDSKSSIKTYSRNITPFDMYYSISGNIVTFTGGGNTMKFTYNPITKTLTSSAMKLTRRD